MQPLPLVPHGSGRLYNNNLITIAFMPKDAKIPPPPAQSIYSLQHLNDVTQQTQSTTTTAPGSTATTAPGTSATTAPGTSATTAPGNSSTPTSTKK